MSGLPPTAHRSHRQALRLVPRQGAGDPDGGVAGALEAETAGVVRGACHGLLVSVLAWGLLIGVVWWAWEVGR